MANELDELSGPVNKEGRDINVIHKQLPIKVGVGSLIFEIALWLLAIIPGLVFLFMKVKASNYLKQLEQRIQKDASQIDNYLEQRVMILTNLSQLINKAVTLDKDTMTDIAALRSGGRPAGDEARNQIGTSIDKMTSNLNVAFENYPELKAQEAIREAMQQNSYLQREITAAREVYNDSVNRWNHDINAWPTKMIVAAKAGYSTRIPFTTTFEIKQQARGTFF